MTYNDLKNSPSQTTKAWIASNHNGKTKFIKTELIIEEGSEATKGKPILWARSSSDELTFLKTLDESVMNKPILITFTDNEDGGSIYVYSDTKERALKEILKTLKRNMLKIAKNIDATMRKLEQLATKDK